MIEIKDLTNTQLSLLYSKEIKQILGSNRSFIEPLGGSIIPMYPIPKHL